MTLKKMMFPKSNKTLTIYDIINNNLKPTHLFSKNKEGFNLNFKLDYDQLTGQIPIIYPTKVNNQFISIYNLLYLPFQYKNELKRTHQKIIDDLMEYKELLLNSVYLPIPLQINYFLLDKKIIINFNKKVNNDLHITFHIKTINSISFDGVYKDVFMIQCLLNNLLDQMNDCFDYRYNIIIDNINLIFKHIYNHDYKNKFYGKFYSQIETVLDTGFSDVIYNKDFTDSNIREFIYKTINYRIKTFKEK